MALFALGLNHSTAPVDVRERVAFPQDALGDALRDLVGAKRVKEAAILSTCNRTEIYFHGEDPDPVAHWLAGFHNLPHASLHPYVYTLPQNRAVTHAFRVASGLDSMVLGEPQILGQMKHAVRVGGSGRVAWTGSEPPVPAHVRRGQGRAHANGHRQRVHFDGRRRGQARRTHLPVHLGAAAAADRGRRNDRAGGHALRRQESQVDHRRQPDLRARSQLASRLGAEAITLNELPDRLAQFDIIVTCTASSLPILGKGMLERVVKQRKHAPVFIVDLAVPRDVEPEAAELDDVFLYSVDDLSEIVKDNLQVRRESVVQAEQMIADQTGHFLRWLEGRTIVPIIAALHGHHDSLRTTELERAKKSLAAGESPDKVLESLARGLTNKFMHAPLSALNGAGEAERNELIALFQHVYKFPDPPADGH